MLFIFDIVLTPQAKKPTASYFQLLKQLKLFFELGDENLWMNIGEYNQ